MKFYQKFIRNLFWQARSVWPFIDITSEHRQKTSEASVSCMYAVGIIRLAYKISYDT